MPTHLELAAKAAYEKFNENLIGCCEDSWEATDESFKLRMIESVAAALQYLREPADVMTTALSNCGIMYKDNSSYGIWTTYIDAILSEK